MGNSFSSPNKQRCNVATSQKEQGGYIIRDYTERSRGLLYNSTRCERWTEKFKKPVDDKTFDPLMLLPP